MTSAGRDKVQEHRRSREPEMEKGFHPTPAITAAAATLKKSQLEGVGSNPCHLMNEIDSCLMGQNRSQDTGIVLDWTLQPNNGSAHH